jgi:ATP-dependent Lon protease
LKLYAVTWEDKCDIDQNDINPLDLIAEKNKKEYENRKYLAYMIEDLSRKTEYDYRDLHGEIHSYLRNKTQESDTSKIRLYPSEYKTVKVFDMNHILKTLKGCNERNVKAVLSKFKNTPHCGHRYLRSPDTKFLKKISELKITFPNCIEFIEYLEQNAALSLKSETRAFKFSPVLLVGSPGIGKTQVVREIASALGVPYKQIDCGSLTSPAVLSGSAITYSDAAPGAIVNVLRDNLYANALLMYDEIDKCRRNISTGYDMVGCLYALLEQSSAKEFTDEALTIPCDASHINHIASANNLSLIDEPLLSRFTVIKINDIEAQHHKAITSSIYKSMLEKSGHEKTFSKRLPEETYKALENLAPRQIKITLMRAMANAAFYNKNKKRIEILEKNLVFDEKKNEMDNRIPMGFY